MPSEEQSSRAVFQSVKDGTYPEDEQVISAELSSTALNNLSELLEQARTDVKVGLYIRHNQFHSRTDYPPEKY